MIHIRPAFPWLASMTYQDFTQRHPDRGAITPTNTEEKTKLSAPFWLTRTESPRPSAMIFAYPAASRAKLSAPYPTVFSPPIPPPFAIHIAIRDYM